MLVTVAATFHVSVASAATAATTYFIAYGISQPVWGAISDRYGRIGVIRLALLIGGIGSVFSALAPTISSLSCARAVTGAAFGAVVPAVITYVGDTVELNRRQSAWSDMLAAMAVGSALSVAVAGAVAQYSTWRWMFAGTALAAVACHFAVHVIRDATAGLLVAVYGVSVLVASRIVKRITANPLVPVALGAGALVLALCAPLVGDGVAPLMFTPILFGITWAGLHTSLQAWMSSTVPAARATCVAWMTTALFLGSGAGTAIGSRLLDDGRIKTMFEFAAALAAVTLTARARYTAPLQVQ